MLPDAKTFAHEWIESWNSHDLDKILDHYSDDFEITTPMIRVALGIESGSLKGKENVRNYWQEAFKKVPNLKFELIEVTQSTNSIAIYYNAVMNKMSIEVMFFNESKKVIKAIVHYN
jgi:ketosteroid isomerase-like protein